MSRRVLGSGAGGNLIITADSFLLFIKKVVFVFDLLCRLERTELIKARVMSVVGRMVGEFIFSLFWPPDVAAVLIKAQVMSVAGRDGGGIYFLAILASGCLRGNLTMCQRAIGLLAWLLCLE